MPRQRMLKPEFFTDEALAACSPLARLLFAGLWTLADRRGRLRDQPQVIGGAVFPFETSASVDGLLEELAKAGFVVRYRLGDKRFVCVTNFEKHQRPHPKEMESVIPAPPAAFFRGSAMKVHGRAVKRRTPSPSESESFPSESESESESESGEGTAAPVENFEPARSQSPETARRAQVIGEVDALAGELAQRCPTVDRRVWVARASEIPAKNGRPAKSFEDPRSRGLPLPWLETTARKLREMRDEARRPPPL